MHHNKPLLFNLTKSEEYNGGNNYLQNIIHETYENKDNMVEELNKQLSGIPCSNKNLNSDISLKNKLQFSIIVFLFLY